MLVDDDLQTLRYVRTTLTDAGYSPIVIGDAGEALQTIEGDRPDLVLLDLILPGTDGIGLMGDKLSVTDVSVIFISAYGRDQVAA